jgi:hypothetical protein
MRTRACAWCGHHYESRARTPRRLLRNLRECGSSAERIVAQLAAVAPLTDLAAQAYLAEQLREQVAAIHKQLVDRLFSVCGVCCDEGGYYRRGPKGSSASERARRALAVIQEAKPSLGKLVRFAAADHTSSQLSLAHIGVTPCSVQVLPSAGKQPATIAASAAESSPSSKQVGHRRKSPPSSSASRPRKSASATRGSRASTPTT